MARLNEPPVAPGPAADTVEAVKRRFLRQNRELAKTNSQQSIRIRNLETEGSRLLAENLSLREQVLQLQNALESRSSRPSFEDIDVVKSKLEAKMMEFGSLIAELGQMRKRNSRTGRKSQAATARRNPEDRQWRSGLGLQAVEEAMLPTITEDKYYPRRTMGADELQQMLIDPESQSPDLGPPPVSRFDSEEPIMFNPSPPSGDQGHEAPDESEPVLPINLETRKKRRESGPKSDMRRVSIFEPPQEEPAQEPSKSLRTGAKRKFSVQEDEEKTDKTTTSEPFRFSRRNVPDSTADTALDNETRPQSPTRPILSSKPVNTDPVISPKKQRSSAAGKPDKKPSTSKAGRSRLTITRNVPSEPPPLQLPQPITTTEITLEPLPPKTPAVEDVHSPQSTEPSTTRPESKDTPPPGDLNSSDPSALGMRPSRRARPQVSYKEPSLNTKMRRPGKELVDAVVPGNSRRTSVEPTSAVKREPEEQSSAWKSLPPVSNRGEDEMEVGSPLREKLGRRDGAQAGESPPEQPKLNSSAASSAISALISATSVAKRKTTASSEPASASADSVTGSRTTTAKSSASEISKEPSANAQEDKDNLAIFDFTASSPNDPPTKSRQRLDLAKAVKTARRHSSVQASSRIQSNDGDSTTSKLDGALPSLHARSGSSGAGRSSSTTSNLSRSGSASKLSSAKEKKSGAALRSADVEMSSSSKSSSSEEVPGTGTLRAERAASRRKSTLL